MLKTLSELRIGGYLLLLLALVMSLNVWIANGNPLFYFDTAGYLKQGDAALSHIAPSSSAHGQGSASAATVQDSDDNRVIGSRSIGYSVVLAAAARLGALEFVPLLQLAVFLVSVWLSVRVIGRAAGVRLETTNTVAAVLAAGCLTALPFYVAFLMPDIFTPILILVVATMVAGARNLKGWELVVLVVIGLFATLSHASHIPIVGLMAVVLVLVAILRSGARRAAGLVAAGLVLGLFVVGVGERVLFGMAVRATDRGEVVYQPYATARLIADGPGLDWLAENCASENSLATCALYPLLKDAPQRRQAARIIFARSENLGSYGRLDTATQNAIAAEQFAFVYNVVTSRPIGVMKAVAGNFLEQLRRNSIWMTLPAVGVIESAGDYMDRWEPGISKQALWPDQTWRKTLTRVHESIYAVSLLGILAMLVLARDRVPAPARVFASVIVLGFLANAFVCGVGVLPADRYGARVALMLPQVFVLLLIMLAPGRQPVYGRPMG